MLYVNDSIGAIVLFATVLVYSIILALGSYFVGLQFYLPIRNKLPSGDSKQIALSFDDGPNEQTEQLLKLLMKHNVKASFFCIGKNIAQYPQIAQQIFDQGHLLCNHSYSHSGFFPLWSSKKVKSELEKTNKLIEAISNTKNNYFRPPFGVSNPFISRAVKSLGMIAVGWSLRSYDTIRSKEEIVITLKKNIETNSIILLHDREETIEALKDFIPYAKEKAYEFVLISSGSEDGLK